MKIAVIGCAHGEIDMILNNVKSYERLNNCKIDLIICCGDFQACRNANDLSCVACPPKYRVMGDFYKYYNGEKKMPIPMIVIGGNHEASNHLLELYYGGWLAPNIYYLGCSGSVIFGGLRIVGASGIFKYYDFNKAHYESCPLSHGDIGSSYHIRRFNIWQLSHFHGTSIDIMMSHDWPLGIWKYGNTAQLLTYKPHLQKDISQNKLGNPSLNHLLFQLQPKYWFSGHMHCKFDAHVHHKDTNNNTTFMALDKCDPSRPRMHRYMNVVDIPCSNDAKLQLEYDPYWLAILKSTNDEYLSVNHDPIPLPEMQQNFFMIINAVIFVQQKKK